jgi:hypothetical protein
MSPFDHQTILEERINDLARLARAMHVIGDTVFSELRSMAEHMPQVADAMMLVEADREVLCDMIEEADVQARDLRIAFDARPSEVA